MPIMISIPDDCKPVAEAVEQLVISATRARHRTRGGRAVDYAQIEREMGERTAAVERAIHQSILAGLDVDAPTVMIDGRVHTCVHRAEGRYYTMAGDVVVARSLYRAARNGPVVDAISLRTGPWRADGCRKRRRRSHTCCSKGRRGRRRTRRGASVACRTVGPVSIGLAMPLGSCIARGRPRSMMH